MTYGSRPAPLFKPPSQQYKGIFLCSDPASDAMILESAAMMAAAQLRAGYRDPHAVIQNTKALRAAQQWLFDNPLGVKDKP